MKSHINAFAPLLALALSVGFIAGCSPQGVDGELPGLEKDRPSRWSVSEEIHATLKSNEGSNRKCTTYDHEGSKGSKWRTHWC
jgi:hypothetical protein